MTTDAAYLATLEPIVTDVIKDARNSTATRASRARRSRWAKPACSA